MSNLIKTPACDNYLQTKARDQILPNAVHGIVCDKFVKIQV